MRFNIIEEVWEKAKAESRRLNDYEKQSVVEVAQRFTIQDMDEYIRNVDIEIRDDKISSILIKKNAKCKKS